MRTLWAGAGVALAAGVSLGAAMRPDLSTADDRPAGPQIVQAGAASRASGPFDDSVAYASYGGGKVPDYVLGTDWKRLQAQTAAVATRWPATVDAGDDDARAGAPPRRGFTPAAFQAADTDEEAPELAATPPGSPAELDPEAPPDAVGDTRAAN